tara:strand:+ start:5058 stop:6011 length:954 start_codon:yes stop_codon:yes gene_type:complete
MKNIAIITGGDSDEYKISLKSAETVFKNIDRSKFNPYIIEIKDNIWKLKLNNSYKIIDSSLTVIIDKEEIIFKDVFMALHGPPAENGELQVIFEKQNINFTCCGSKISELTFNKFKCNKVLQELGYSIADSILINSKNYKPEEINQQINTPFIVKPNQAGSSNGISLVKNIGMLNDAIQTALKHDNDVIIEEYIDGTEISCGVFKIKDDIILLPITEIISENDFFDYEAKYHNKSKEITPARISKKQKEEVHLITKKIYEQLELRGLCRVDYIIKENQPYIIEINTIPGLSEKSIFPQQLEKAGYNLKEVFTICLEN